MDRAAQTQLPDIVSNPGSHDHFVQLYQALDPLAEAVSQYVNTGLRRGEAAVVIATPRHREAFLARIDSVDDGRL